MSNARLGTWGFGPHPWVSVERTRRFYARTLAERFTLVDLDRDGHTDGRGRPEVDAIMSFASARWFAEPRPDDTPIVLAMHGGPVVEHAELRELVPKLRTSDTLLVNCRADVAILEALCEVPPNIVVLPLPVDLERFAPWEPEPCRAELGLEGDDLVLGFVARLVPQKNLHGFLRVVAEVRRRLAPRRVRALVIGNFAESYPVLDYGCGAYVDRIKALVRELELGDALVYFSARLDDDQLAAAYGAMDLLVHPTMAIDENFGYVAIEAMASAVPVVAAAYGGVADSVIPGRTGALLPTWASGSGIRMDLGGAVEVIVELLGDRGRREQLGFGAVEHARASYGEARCAAILREAVAAAARRRGEGEPLRVRPISELADAGLLPATDPPYAAFAEPIAHYVSRPTPRLEPDRRVRWAAPLGRDPAGELRLDEPAWPAAVRLDPRDGGLLRRCAEPVAAARLAEPGTAAWARLQGLVDAGLLIPEEPALV